MRSHPEHGEDIKAALLELGERTPIITKRPVKPAVIYAPR
jgi:hypothetical protein